MTSQIAFRLHELQIVLNYLTPSLDWEPQKYNRFVELLEESITEPQQIIQELKADKNTDQELLRQASLLLEKYLTLQQEHYS